MSLQANNQKTELNKMSVTIKVDLRDNKGSASSRRLRLTNQTPGVIYGIEKKPITISLDSYKFNHLLTYSEYIFSRIITLDVNKSPTSVIIKDLQRHPASNAIMHVDFLRVDDKHKIITSIPLNFININKNQALRLGAVLNEFMNSIEVICLPSALVQKIDVDVADLSLGEHLTLLEIKIPENITIKALTHGNIEIHNQTVVSVASAKKISLIEEEEEEEQKQTEVKEQPEPQKDGD